MIHVVYRLCELEAPGTPKREARPTYFNKVNCLKNMLNTFGYGANHITFVHDGPKAKLWECIEELEDTYKNVQILKINARSNQESLRSALEVGKHVDCSIVYQLEDDYLHVSDAAKMLWVGRELTRSISSNPAVFSLYDHPDRYTRSDNRDAGKTSIHFHTCHWRTAESTTCTWACDYDHYDTIVKYAEKHLLNDRKLFYDLADNGIKLYTPMPGAATHCHEPFLSPGVYWKDIKI